MPVSLPAERQATANELRSCFNLISVFLSFHSLSGKHIYHISVHAFRKQKFLRRITILIPEHRHCCFFIHTRFDQYDHPVQCLHGFRILTFLQFLCRYQQSFGVTHKFRQVLIIAHSRINADAWELLIFFRQCFLSGISLIEVFPIIGRTPPRATAPACLPRSVLSIRRSLSVFFQGDTIAKQAAMPQTETKA